MSGDDSDKRYEGYSDYSSVSSRVATSIDRAVDSYSTLDALHTENARIRPNAAAEIRRHILAAALKLKPELEANTVGGSNDDEDIQAEILDRWVGEEGFIERFRETSLQDDCPDWLYDFVNDIRRAGWEIGYLQAGRTVDDGIDSPEDTVRDLFD